MNIKRILFPVDFSDCSRALNPEVEWMANRFNAQVTLMHVFEVPITWYGTGEVPLINPDVFQHLQADAEKCLQDYSLRIPADRVNRILAEGNAPWNIRRAIDEHHIDLVMMGTHGFGSFGRTLLGSVAMKLLHDASCPIWTRSATQTHARPFDGVSRILCALEATQEAVPLLKFVSGLAQDCSASVHLVHAVPEARPYRYFEMDVHNYLKECAAKDIEQSQREAGTDFPVTITDGPVALDAAALAGQDLADLVVVGRGRAQNFLGTLRTHTYDIIRQAHCPVLSYCTAWTGTSPSTVGSKADPVLV